MGARAGRLDDEIEAALRLACLAGLGTEACHEAVDVCDLALLPLEHCLLHGEARGTLRSS